MTCVIIQKRTCDCTGCRMYPKYVVDWTLTLLLSEMVLLTAALIFAVVLT